MEPNKKRIPINRDGHISSMDFNLPISLIGSAWIATTRPTDRSYVFWKDSGAPYAHFWLPKGLKVGDMIHAGIKKDGLKWTERTLWVVEEIRESHLIIKKEMEGTDYGKKREDRTPSESPHIG